MATTDGSDAPAGTWEYSVAEIKGEFSDAGKYTITAVYTITEGGAKLQNSFPFEITPASVKAVEYQGEAFTYGGLKDGDTIAVFVTYNDGFEQPVNATFTATTSTGGYVIAGETVSLTLTGDDGKNTNYAKVKDQTVTVSVSKAEITANISYMGNSAAEGVLILPYIGQEGYAITAEPVGVLDGDVVELTVDTVITNAQTYTNLEIALLSDAGDSANYNLTGTDTLSVVVTPAEINITVEPESDTYTGEAIALTVTAGEGEIFGSDEVTFTVSGEGVENNAVTNAGKYELTVDKAGAQGGNYTIVNAQATVEIAKAEVDIVWGSEQTDYTYNGKAVTLTADVQFNGKSVGTAEITYTGENITDGQGIDVGQYTATAAYAETDNFKASSEDFDFNITPAEITVVWGNLNPVYTGAALTPTATAQGIDGITLDVVVLSEGQPVQAVNAGEYTAKVEAFDAGNYKLSTAAEAQFEIYRREIWVTAEGESVYNGEAVVPEFTIESDISGMAEGVVMPEFVLANIMKDGESATEIKNAGSYTFDINFAGENAENFIEHNTGDDSCAGTYTVTKANLTLTPSEVSFSNLDEEMMDKYSENNYATTIKADVTVTGVGNDGEFNEFTIDTSATFTEGKLAVGDYTFTIRVASGNYNDATFTVKVTEQEVVTLTATPSSTVYTGSPITFTFGNEVLPEGVEITYTVQKDGNPVESVLDAGRYTVTFAVTGNSADNDKWYEVTVWSDTISPAVVDVTAVTAVYGDVYTALETGDSLQHGTVWQYATFNGSPVEVTVTVTDATARAGETYLGADTYDVTVTLVSGNFTFAGGSNSVASTLQITPKQLNIAAQLPEDLTYTSEGIVIGLEDYASQLVGDDNVTVSMLVDGEPYVAGVTVLSAGVHTVTFTITDASGNYGVADTSSSTFTVAKKPVTPSINVAGDKVENNSTLEMDKGENMRVETAIDNFIADNGIKEGEYTLSVKDASGADKKLDEIAAWAPGTYTVTVALGDNYDGSLTFSIVVKEGTTAQIPEPPALPSTPLEDSGSSLSTTDWLFPLIIAVECLIAAVLVAAIVIAAIKRSK